MGIKVGIQLYSVKTAMSEDPADAIRQVIESGYRHLEIANHTAGTDPGVGFGMTAKQVNDLVRTLGADIIGAHLFPLNDENMGEVLDFHAEIGNKNIITPMEFYTGRDDVLRRCERFNQIGEECKKRGMRFLYHNHFHEFARFDGECPLRLIAGNTDPELVFFELDTYWTMRAGQDPVAIMRELGSRMVMLHQKDYPNGREKEINLFERIDINQAVSMEMFLELTDKTLFTEIGTGVMEIQGIIDAAGEYTAAEYIVLEQDATQLGDEIESISVSMDSFRKFKGIVW